MGLRDLIFTKPEEKERTPVQKFPDAVAPSNIKFDEIGAINTGSWKTAPVSCDPYIADVVEIYEKGFEGLNMQGYDFYEMYKAIIAAGDDSPGVYKMAFNMGKGMDPSLTKEKLLSQSEHYLDEIQKVYEGYVSSGKIKSDQIKSNKSNEQQSLLTRINENKRKLQDIQNILNTDEESLKNIDLKYSSTLTEMDCKILANETAKNKIIESITKVANGIKSNV